MYEKVLYGWLTKLVGIEKMQCRIMLGKETVNLVFILTRLNEKFTSKNKKLF